MKVKRLLTTTGLLLSLMSPAVPQEAYDERQDHATNHGHYTAALEKVCPGMTVTNAKTARPTRQEVPQEPALGLAGLSLGETGAKEWLMQDPAAIDLLEINKNKYEAAKRKRLGLE